MPNHCTIVVCGHLGRDSETRMLPDGTPVTKFSIAYSDTREKTTLWFEVTLWRKEKLGRYLTKGKAVLVTGTLGLHEWEGKDGKRTALTINATGVTFLGSREDGEQREPAVVSRPRGASSATDEDLPF